MSILMEDYTKSQNDDGDRSKPARIFFRWVAWSNLCL